MEDFQLFDILTIPSEETPCAHTDMEMDKGMRVCRACGLAEQLNEGQSFANHKMYKRSAKNTSIAQVLEQKGFDRRIIIVADAIYNLVINEHAKRTGNKNSVICACTFQAFKHSGQPVDYVHIYSKFAIKKRAALKGLKIVNTEIAKHKASAFHDIISCPITPENFIVAYMAELHASRETVEEVLALYARIQDHRELNMSRPQSIAAGLIYYWLKEKDMLEAMKVIEDKAHLSQLTISKKAKLVAQKLEELDARQNDSLAMLAGSDGANP